MPHRPPRARSAAALLVAVLVLAGCSDDGGGGAAPPTTTTPAPSLQPLPPSTDHPMTRNPAAEVTGPGVDEVVAPARAACDEGTEVEVPVSWSAPAATSVRLLVDGEPLPGEQPPVGEAGVALPCDGVVHVVVVAALDDGPEPSLGSVAVLTEPRG